MLATSAIRCIFLSAVCFLFVLAQVGCSKDMTPTQTEADELDQYLLENPEEAFSSDGVAEEMAEDDGEG